MSKGVKTMFAKIMANVFEEDENANDGNNPLLMDLVNECLKLNKIKIINPFSPLNESMLLFFF